ncbi:type II secretion system GspH family protein [Patescibacteria group bacterium]|nr:type II secretion system GspH family protein [Patescibacteria group bacterium]
MMDKKLDNKGFTLVEIVVAIGIMAIIFAFGVQPFIAMKNRKALDNSVEKIESLLHEARSMTMSSVGDSQYGVHFEETKAALFKGSVYSSLDLDNKWVYLENAVVISEINLSGGVSDVVFKRLNGETENPGNIKFSLVSNPTKFKILTIFLGGTFFNGI